MHHRLTLKTEGKERERERGEKGEGKQQQPFSVSTMLSLRPLKDLWVVEVTTWQHREKWRMLTDGD
ncbi:MAG: hypothetical protein ACKESB_03850 [Candidatus Hodgkinia cicadicola]